MGVAGCRFEASHVSATTLLDTTQPVSLLGAWFLPAQSLPLLSHLRPLAKDVPLTTTTGPCRYRLPHKYAVHAALY